MDDHSILEKFVNQSRSSDVDARVDAVTKLQAEFERGVQINDPDGLIDALKGCLRTSNQHLIAATLSALPPLLPLLITPSFTRASATQSSSSNPPLAVDIVTLRQVLLAFLPAGGVIDRLGDNREKTREKARETLVILGGLAFRASVSSVASSKSRDGKGSETPLMVFERLLKESGLGSKVWRTREQAVFTLLHIRRSHYQFPIRPYLPQLVSALEDTDAHVRECARPSVIELFTGPGVTDAARADLKKEMTKKGVRKTIVDAVLSKLVAGISGAENPETGDAQTANSKEYVPPSLMLQSRKPAVGSTSATVPTALTRAMSLPGSAKDVARPDSRAATTEPTTPVSENTELKPVYITSSRDMESEFTAMAKHFEGKESEHNWEAREAAVARVRGMIKGDAHARYTDAFLACLKEGFIQWSFKSLASLRTTLATNTISLYSELANALGTSLDPFCESLLTHLLRMSGFTKKIVAQQSQASVTVILQLTSAQPRVVLPLLWNSLQEKTVQARAFVVGHLKTYMEVHCHRSKTSIESSGGLDLIEKSLKRALADANPAVRESARACFWVFEEIWQDRGAVILASLDAPARKQLEKACPRPQAAAVSAPVTPTTAKKTSVAAVIAASRAKAKTIAAAPPSLRHQATSTSQSTRAMSPSSKQTPQPSLSPKSATRSMSPTRSPVSPSSPKARVSSSGSARTTVPNKYTSNSPPGSTRAISPASSVPNASTSNRRVSSNFGTSPTRGSTLGRALQTALPPSPISQPLRNVSKETTNRASVKLSDASVYESLLIAASMPLPDASDSEDSAGNMLSFSAAFEASKAESKAPSPVLSFSPRSDHTTGLSNALSTGSATGAPDQPIVEDALRARAEQAESAAERLLELVDPEDDLQHSTMPTSLLVGNRRTPSPPAKPKPAAIPIPIHQLPPPATPMNRNAAILKQAALFQDSPAHNGTQLSLLDVLKDGKQGTDWWTKRMATVRHGANAKIMEPTDRVEELNGFISALEEGRADVHLLQRLARFCVENPVVDIFSPPLSPISLQPSSPSPFIERSASFPTLKSQFWTKDKNFDRFFGALIKFLEPTKSESEIEYGLIVLWEVLEHLASCIEGREADIFSILLKIRYCNQGNVLEASNAIRDALTSRIEPVYGLTTLHANLRTFLAESAPEFSNATVKSATYAFGLIALGKFVLRLPPEILEEELPRLKNTLISALNDMSSLVVRESAAASIIASQLVLRDETHLFALLDGLADEKKNLLTYLFDKHGVRGLSMSNGTPPGIEKLQKELKRLDTRTSTPPRPAATPSS